MKPYYSDPELDIFHGDNREVLPSLASESIDSCVCDPPYELGFMGKGWDRSGIAYDVTVWRECLRVLKPGGHLLAFGGSRTYHRLACAIEDAGFEIRDQIQWIYGSGFPKSLDVSKAIDAAVGIDRNPAPHVRVDTGFRFQSGSTASLPPSSSAAKQWDGWGTALKPAHEPIVLARRPLSGTVAENVLEHGTGGLNIDACRIETSQADQNYINERIGGFNQTQSIGGNGKYGGGETMDRTAYDATKGRWPANVIHDGSDEVLTAFPDAPGQQRYVGPEHGDRPSRGIYGDFGPRPSNEPRQDFGSAARFFYCAKASQDDRDEGLEDLPHRSAGQVTDRKDGSDGLNSPRAGAGRTNGSRNHHPTVKPTRLMRYLVRLITLPDGIVLDPFGGSGSTAKACQLEGMKAILIEKELEYCELAVRRAVQRQNSLFNLIK